MTTQRDEAIKEALSWVGTPYQHQMSVKKYGCDCLGLVRGVWRKLYGSEPETIPPYTPNWAERGDDEVLKSACARLMKPLTLEDVRPGDVMLFRMRAGCPAKHMAIVVAPDIIVHAYWGRAVTRSLISPFWIKRRAYAFAFPPKKSREIICRV